MRITCKGYWTPSTPNGPSEFNCEYENSKGFDCGECIINGGNMSPVSGKPFRGNPEPYLEECRRRYEARNNSKEIEINIEGILAGGK